MFDTVMNKEISLENWKFVLACIVQGEKIMQRERNGIWTEEKDSVQDWVFGGLDFGS